MIDIHAHVIWGVDDGPKTKEEAVELCLLAEKEGIETMVATSHANHPTYHAEAKEVEEKLEELKDALKEKGSELNLVLGHEVRITERLLDALENGEIHTLAGTRYILVEFPSDTVPLFTKKLIVELVARNYRPVIAHPERNKLLANDFQKLRELIEGGAYAQVTAGSIAGDFGKGIQRVSMRMIDEGLIHCYGSDVHNKNVREFSFDKGLSYLEKKQKEDVVEYFLENNERLLTNMAMKKIEYKESVLNRIFGYLSKR